MTDFADLARSVIDDNSYMVLGTADESGHPWVSPVWFATVDRRHFHWVSGHETRHSRNLEAQPSEGGAPCRPALHRGSRRQ